MPGSPLPPSDRPGQGATGPNKEYFHPQTPELASETPDLTMTEWEEPLVGSGTDADQPVQQSIFSTRSGIQDLLVKPGNDHDPAETDDVSADDGQPGLRGSPEADGRQRSQGREKGRSAGIRTESGEAEYCPLPEADEDAQPRERRGKAGRHGKANAIKSRRQLDRVRRRQKNYLEIRREQKKRMVFFNRIRLIFKLSFAVLWAVLLWEMVQSPLWNFQTPQFKIIRQAGQPNLLQDNQLAPFVTPWVGKPLYQVDTGKIADAIEANYDIADHVSVRRRLFPARLEIIISEKQPWAEIYADEKQSVPYGLLAPDSIIGLKGYQYRSGIYEHPLEKIIIAPRTPVKPKLLDGLRETAWQARQIPDLHFTGLDARNQNLIVLHYQEIPVILGRLDRDAPERLARLTLLIPKILELREGLVSVDLRWDQQVTLHTKPNVDLGLNKKADIDG